MKFQLIALFGLVFLATVSMAQDNSTDTAALAPSEDVKPASKADEPVPANQKVENQDLEKAKADAKDAAANAKEAGSSAIDATKEKAGEAADAVKSGAADAAGAVSDKAAQAKDKIENSASSYVASSLIGSVALLALARL